MISVARWRVWIGIAVLSLCVTLGVQSNLTKALLFGAYASHPYIVAENDDESFYLHLVQRFTSGQGRTNTLTYPFLGMRLEAAVERVTGWELKIVSIVFDYIAVFLLSCVTLWASWIFFSRRWLGIWVGAIYLCWPWLFHSFSRPVSPQVNGIFLFIALACFFRRAQQVPWLVAQGASLGLLFSIYPYYWTFVLVWTVLEEIRLAYLGVWKRSRLWMYGATVVAALPYMLHGYTVHALPFYNESMARLGLLHDRWPAGLMLLAFIGAFAILLAWLERVRRPASDDEQWRERVCATGLATSLIVLTQQVFTGVQLEAAAHYLPVIFYVFCLVCGLVVSHLFVYIPRRAHVYMQIAFVLSIILLFGYSLEVRMRRDAFQHLSENTTYPVHPSEQAVYQWFRKQGIEKRIVAVPYEMSERVLLYTKNQPVFSPLDRLLLEPTQDLVDRFQYADIGNAELNLQMKDQVFDLFGLTYQAPRDRAAQWVSWRNRLLRANEPIPSMEVFFDQAVSRAFQQRTEISEEGYQRYLDRFEVNYIVYPRREATNPLYRSLRGSVVYSNEEYVVIRCHP